MDMSRSVFAVLGLLWTSATLANTVVEIPPCIDTSAERARLMSIVTSRSRHWHERTDALHELERCLTLAELSKVIPDIEASADRGQVRSEVFLIKAKLELESLDDFGAIAHLQEYLSPSIHRVSPGTEHWALQELLRRGAIEARDAIHAAYARDFTREYAEIGESIDRWLHATHSGRSGVVAALYDADPRVNAWSVDWLARDGSPEAVAAIQNFVSDLVADCMHPEKWPTTEEHDAWRKRWAAAFGQAMSFLDSLDAVPAEMQSKCMMPSK